MKWLSFQKHPVGDLKGDIGTLGVGLVLHTQLSSSEVFFQKPKDSGAVSKECINRINRRRASYVIEESGRWSTKNSFIRGHLDGGVPGGVVMPFSPRR